jgi:AcrR family transcriptional regulator
MSPKKVNKEEKRREIAIACFDLIHDIGMKNITVAQVAKVAGIGKGTVYEYFENKEDIIFEIINMHIEKQHSEVVKKVTKLETAREKVELFFDLILSETAENMKRFNGYKDVA